MPELNTYPMITPPSSSHEEKGEAVRSNRSALAAGMPAQRLLFGRVGPALVPNYMYPHSLNTSYLFYVLKYWLQTCIICNNNNIVEYKVPSTKNMYCYVLYDSKAKLYPLVTYHTIICSRPSSSPLSLPLYIYFSFPFSIPERKRKKKKKEKKKKFFFPRKHKLS